MLDNKLCSQACVSQRDRRCFPKRHLQKEIYGIKTKFTNFKPDPF